MVLVKINVKMLIYHCLIFVTKFFKIYQSRNDNVGYRSFDGVVQPQLDSFVQHFLELECGKSYIIILKKGSAEINLPNFTETHIDSRHPRIIAQCIEPETPTPTPTPTPHPNTDSNTNTNPC